MIIHYFLSRLEKSIKSIHGYLLLILWNCCSLLLHDASETEISLTHACLHLKHCTYVLFHSFYVTCAESARKTLDKLQNRAIRVNKNNAYDVSVGPVKTTKAA